MALTNVSVIKWMIIKENSEQLYICGFYASELAPVLVIARMIGPDYVITVDPVLFAFACLFCRLVTSGWASRQPTVVVFLGLQPKWVSFGW